MEPLPLSIDVVPSTSADRDKLAEALHVIVAEGAAIAVRTPRPELTVISAATDLDLERVLERLAREFGVEATVGRPTVEYRETLTRSAEGGAKVSFPARREYAHVVLRLRPLDAGAGETFSDATVGQCIPKRFMASIENGISGAKNAGIVHGYPVVDVAVEICDGSYHETDSTDEAFRAAAAAAFIDAAKKAEPVVLEPVMAVVVRAEDTYRQDVIDDLLARRGALEGPTSEPDQVVVTAHVPLAQLFGYESHLRELTRGHASCTIRFLAYRAMVQGPDDDEESGPGVTAPRRPRPHSGITTTALPEPDDQ